MAPFYPFEVTIPHIIYACLGGFIVLFGMFSLFLRSRLYISEACWAFLFGVIIGPYCADIFNPRAWSSPDDEEAINVITLEFTRVVLAIGVFAIGVELPKAYMKRHWKSLFFLLVPVMTWGWLVSAAFIYALIPGLNFLTSLAVAACLTPTDPILAAAVIGGKWADKHVPAHIRHLLAAESGCNDGAAFPFLFLALYLLLDHPDAGRAMRDWFLLLWLYQVVLGAVVGASIGFGFRYLMKFCERMDLIDRHSYVAQYVSMAIFTIGVCTLLGSDDLLAAFACGTAFAWDGFFNRQTEESVFSSVIDLLFNIAAFVYLGAWMPFSKFQDEHLTLSVWRLIVIAILVLLFRRLPIMIVCYRWIPDIKNFREALFSGHFGPIGVGAVFISTLALEIIHRAHKTPENSSNYHQIEMLVETMQPIVAFMVLTSITIHGLSIPSFSLGRRVHSVGRTLSRHATAQSGVMQPEWMHSARAVVRGDEKIVINRDLGAGAGRERVERDLERGSDSEKTREGSLGTEKDVVIAEGLPRDVQFVPGEGARRRDSALEATTTPSGERDLEAQLDSAGAGPAVPEPAYVPPASAKRVWSDVGLESPRLDQGPYAAGRGEDGRGTAMGLEEEVISEWKEGSQRVIERKRGPGDDPEVTVIKNPKPEGTEGEGLGRKLSREISFVADSIQNAGRRAAGRAAGVVSPAVVSASPRGAGATTSSSLQAESASGTASRVPSIRRRWSARRSSGSIRHSGGHHHHQQQGGGEKELKGKQVQREGGAEVPTSSTSPVPGILVSPIASSLGDEGEWSSEDEEDDEERSGAKGRGRAGRGGGGKGHLHMHQHQHHAAGGKRRRMSVRSSGSGSSPITSPTMGERRGRTGSSGLLGENLQLRGRGLGASGAGTRDASPARSVRFMEGVRTPRGD